MENYANNQNEQQEEEIPNIEQFQVSRSSLDEKGLEDDDADAATEDAGYTSEEVEFADGEGTQLDEEIPDETEDDELLGDDLEDDEEPGEEAGFDTDLDDEELEEDEEI